MSKLVNSVLARVADDVAKDFAAQVTVCENQGRWEDASVWRNRQIGAEAVRDKMLRLQEYYQ